jgi:hypothetical protein
LEENIDANHWLEMLTELKTIFFQTELMLPPIREFRISKAKIRALYARLHEPGGYPYENIANEGGETKLSTNREESNSVLHFCPRHIRIEEYMPIDSIDGIMDNVKTVLTRMGDDFPPFILLQRCRFQCLAKPQHVDSIELLAHRMADVYDKFTPLGRPPAYFGIRFRFLPMYMLMDDFQEEEGQGEGEEKDSYGGMSETDVEETGAGAIEPLNLNESDNAHMTLRFETYTKDISYVWMEAAAEFRAFTRSNVFTANDVDRIAENIKDTYRFLSERCTKFLEQWDVPRDVDGGES